jgi:polygalacturonase
LNIDEYSREPGPTLLGHANQRHVLFAKDADNITIAGTGRIDGQGPHFWIPSGRKPLSEDDQWAEVTAHAWRKSPSGRASPILEFVNCRWLRIEDVHIDNAAEWTLRPINCDNVFITGVVIKNQNIGSNTDGMDLTGCQNVLFQIARSIQETMRST